MKSEKNMADRWYYLTMVRSGTYANAFGTFLFLGSGENMNNYVLSESKLVNSHCYPTGSKFLLNDN